MGEGSQRRPRLISQKEETLRWNLFRGRISVAKFKRELQKIKGK